MPTTSQGIYYPDSTTSVAPLHTAFSTMASSIDNILAGDVQIHKVANTSARNALVSQFPPSAANPLFVWRADAPNSQQLEYTKNGTTWHYVPTTEDDTGLITVPPASAGSAGFTVQTGWSITGDIRYRRHGKVVYLYLYHVTRTGGAISVDNKGDITNSGIVQLPNALRPGTPTALSSGATGRMGAWYIDTNTGIITLSAVGGTANIATNEQLSCGGTYLVP